MGTSKRLAPYYDMQAQHRAILRAAEAGPLQTLTDRELAMRSSPSRSTLSPTARSVLGSASDRKRYASMPSSAALRRSPPA